MQQDNKFLDYYRSEKNAWNIPPWAHGYYWWTFDDRLDLLWKQELGWDFGLSCEEEALHRYGLTDCVNTAFFNKLRLRKAAFEKMKDT